MTSDAFLIIFLVFLACITFFPAILRRWGIPGVISLMLVGILAGPNALNMLSHLTNTLHFLGTPDIVYNNFSFFIAALGSLGLVFLMALAGMEADFKLIDNVKKPVTLLSILTFLLPAITGYFVYAYFKPDDLPGKLLYASLFASHSVGIVFPVIRELNLSKTKFGAAVLISTIVTDVASIILLAVSVQLRKQELPVSEVSGTGLSLFNYIDPQFFGKWFLPVFLLIVLIYMAVSIFTVQKVGKWIINKVDDKDALITIFLFIVMVTVMVGELLGVNLIVGAFIGGMGLSPLISHQTIGRDIFRKFEGIGYGLLIPFLFISIGMDTDLRVFNSVSNLQILIFTIIGLVGSKVLSGFAAMKLSGYSNAKGICAGLMTVPQLSATLAAAAVGKDLGMLDDHFFNAIVILSIVTTLPIPTLVRAIIYGKKLTFDPVKEEVYTIPRSINDDLI
ncbi:MAG: cation:proton antiporter [Lentisphaeria bacterium]|nr:cation:proton antiporter [Lentisphaeria bacterium]